MERRYLALLFKQTQRPQSRKLLHAKVEPWVRDQLLLRRAGGTARAGLARCLAQDALIRLPIVVLKTDDVFATRRSGVPWQYVCNAEL